MESASWEPKRPQSTLGFVQGPSETGPSKEKSDASPTDLVDSASTIRHPTLGPQGACLQAQTDLKRKRNAKRTYMQESPPPSRGPMETWNAKYNVCRNNSPNTESFRTSAVELISNGEASTSFYDSYCKDVSLKLWLPIKTALAGSHSISSTMFSGSARSNSSFKETHWDVRQKKNWGRTSCPSFMYSAAGPTGNENTSGGNRNKKRRTTKKKEKKDQQNEEPEEPKKPKKPSKYKQMKLDGKVLRCLKIRVKLSLLTKEQKETLHQCFGTYRFIYNEAVAADEKGEILDMKKATESALRTRLTAKKVFKDHQPWKDVLPSHGRQSAIKEFFVAKRNCLAKCSKKEITHFKMHRKSKYKSPQECVPWERHQVHASRGELCVSYQRKALRFKVRGKMPKALRGRNDIEWVREEIKLVRDRVHRYFFVIQVPVQQSKKEAPHDIVALDPGVRTFMTYYSPCGLAGDVGVNEEDSRLRKLCNKLDRLVSLIDRLKQKNVEGWSRLKRELKRRKWRLIDRIKNVRKDFHRKTASWLCSSFKTILLPKFETSRMLEGGRLHHKVARSMATWAHYSFKEGLLDQSQKYTDCKVFIVNEHYTSKTRGSCGFMDANLGPSKTFDWPLRGMKADRDLNAARNILLRNASMLYDIV